MLTNSHQVYMTFDRSKIEQRHVTVDDDETFTEEMRALNSLVGGAGSQRNNEYDEPYQQRDQSQGLSTKGISHTNDQNYITVSIDSSSYCKPSFCESARSTT